MPTLPSAYVEVSPVKIPGTNVVIGYAKKLVVNNIRLPWPEGEAGEDLLELRVHAAGVAGGYMQGVCALEYTGELVLNPDWDEQDDQSPQFVVPSQFADFAGRSILNVKVLGISNVSILQNAWLCMADAGIVPVLSREDWAGPQDSLVE